jgi:hypothetical protein
MCSPYRLPLAQQFEATEPESCKSFLSTYLVEDKELGAPCRQTLTAESDRPLDNIILRNHTR